MQDEDSRQFSEELPWPQKGDQLFIVGDDWWHNACLNFMSDKWELYVIGYRTAADILVDYVKQTHGDQDFLVFPIVFLYRQYLELRLKDLIRTGNPLLDEPPDFPKKHELNKLWEICRPILEKLEPQVPSQDLEAIKEAIAKFCTIDPSSESFRYPFRRKGGHSLPPDLRYINLRNLAEIMEKIANFLDGAATMIAEYLNDKRDMERYFQDLHGWYDE